MNSAEFLDAVRERHGLTSDYQVGKFLEMSSGRISQFRTGTREFDDATSIKIAAALDEQPLYVIASINAERAKRTEVREVWDSLVKVGKEIRTAPLLAFVALAGLSAPLTSALRDAGQCILCKVRDVCGSRRRLNGLYELIVLVALLPAVLLLSGCAASPMEKTWQTMHLVDVAQTMNGSGSDSCFSESDPLTRAFIGEKQSHGTVLAWGAATGLLHYKLDRWLENTGRADKIGWKIARSIELTYKGVTIANNHQAGVRVFSENICP